MSFIVLFWFSGLLSSSSTFTQRYLPGDKVFAIDEEQKPFGIPYLNLGSKKELFEGDIAIPIGRNALRNITYRWKFPIPYILGDSLDLNAKGAVFQAFEMYRLKSCVDFKPYEGEKTFIKFEKLDGCWSFVGDLQTGQELSLGDGCDHKAVIEHELLHALGFYHEQSRTDRDDYVNIHWEEVQQGKEHNFVKYNDSFITDQNTPYDYESIMHYGPYSFNKNVSAPTVTCKIPEFDNIIGQYLDFSNMDIIRLNRMYNCSSSLTLLDHCAFESINICGMIQSSKDDEDWVHIKSISGMDDHTLLGQCRDAGYFMYFNTKEGKEDQSAVLESRILYPRRDLQCLQFFYKMTGNVNDKLVIWIKKDDGSGNVRTLVKVHTFKGDQDSSWKIAHVPFQATSKFRYLFQGVKGNPAQSNGGIYIDDINLVETRCPSGVWQIKNFTGFLLTSPSGEYIQSPQFNSPEGYSYGIQVIPNSSYKGYTGIFFHLFSGVDDGALEWPVVNRQASITVLDQDPDIRLRMSSSKSFTTSVTQDADGNFYWDNPSKNGKYDSNCQCYKSGTWGWRTFISHYDLHRRNYLKNDDLIVFVDFEDLTPLIKTEVTLSGLNPENELHNKV
ncbi:meprin A subunit alpha-like [Erpetoichthys calabaricus]|uniref:meprin A subunit alpha-like n=1 Tax=Erpetoichthys calabaricus TaxID=27687 RepID=UPI0022344734|nr:meprin A subunit alpha-like [Erpetoichthys calabaricus]